MDNEKDFLDIYNALNKYVPRLKSSYMEGTNRSSDDIIDELLFTLTDPKVKRNGEEGQTLLKYLASKPYLSDGEREAIIKTAIGNAMKDLQASDAEELAMTEHYDKGYGDDDDSNSARLDRTASTESFDIEEQDDERDIQGELNDTIEELESLENQLIEMEDNDQEGTQEYKNLRQRYRELWHAKKQLTQELSEMTKATRRNVNLNADWDDDTLAEFKAKWNSLSKEEQRDRIQTFQNTKGISQSMKNNIRKVIGSNTVQSSGMDIHSIEGELQDILGVPFELSAYDQPIHDEKNHQEQYVTISFDSAKTAKEQASKLDECGAVIDQYLTEVLSKKGEVEEGFEKSRVYGNKFTYRKWFIKK